MKKWAIACAMLITLIGTSTIAFGQSEIVERERRQVQIDIFVAQVNRAAAQQFGLIGANPARESTLVDSEQARQALQTLANLGLAQEVTRPTLRTFDGQNAVIQVGDQVAVPVSGAAGAASVRYVPTGVCMKVTPTIRDNGQVLLAIESQISRRSEGSVRLDNGEQAPVFDVTAATLRAELPDGQTWMLTQSYACACKEKADTLPILAFMPLFGRLAGFAELTPENSVYLVLVTPRLISPPVAKDLFQIEARICEGDPNGSREAGTMKIVANPTLVTRDGCTADFKGGELAALTPQGAVQYVEYGTHVTVLPHMVDDTWVHLDMKLELTDRTADADPSVLRVAGQTSRVVGKFKLGEPVRVMIDKGEGKKLWCDVTVTAANP